MVKVVVSISTQGVILWALRWAAFLLIKNEAGKSRLTEFHRWYPVYFSTPRSTELSAMDCGPEGYDSWTFAMQDSSVVLPYTKNPDGEVFIGLIKENRANLGGEYWCALGGFADPGESFKDAAVRETSEESGMDAQTCVQLPGCPVVEDRLLFVADPKTGEGCNVNYGFLIPCEELKQDADGNYRLINNPTSHKKADQLVFFPWKEAVKVTPDGIALAAIAQLLTVVI